MRLVRGGPFVPAELRYGPSRDPETGGILEERSWMWETWIDGKLVCDPSPDPTKAGVWRVWECATAIDEAEFRFMCADAEWCRAHAPEEPPANPRRKVSLSSLPPSHFLPRSS